MLSLNYSSANRHLIRSAPLAHCAVTGCLLFRICQRTSMSHRGHREWGGDSLLKNDHGVQDMPVQKMYRIDFLVAARPGHPSTGQIRRPPLDRKDMRYACGSSPVAKVFQIHFYSSAHPYCVVLCPANNPAAISCLNSLHCTRPFCRSR